MKIANILFYLIFITNINAQESDYKIHNDLRVLLKGIENSVNSKDYKNLNTYFHKNLKVTVVNQNTISSYDGITAYFEEWFGENGYLKSLHMELKPDSLTKLYKNKTIGIVTGTGIEQYKLSDGRDLDLKTRWTATLIKDSQGKWSILSLHLGTNFYDNVIFNQMKNTLTKWIIISAIIALLIGVIIGFFISKKRKISKNII